MRACWASGVVALLLNCAGLVPEPRPTPEHKIVGCYVACPLGYALRQQHLCRGDRTQFKDILISGEEDEPGNPSASRWLTGVSQSSVDRIVVNRLKSEGITPLNKEWAPRFRELVEEIRDEVGNDAMETYLKIDVVLKTCSSVIAMRCSISQDCDHHPGEPDPRNPEHR